MLLTTILILSKIDITLTYYMFFLDKKKGIFDYRIEKGFLQRTILKKGITPSKLLISLIGTISILIILMKLVTFLGYSRYIFMLLGMFVMINIIHFLQLQDISANWKNKKYWFYYKKLRGVTNED